MIKYLQKKNIVKHKCNIVHVMFNEQSRYALERVRRVIGYDRFYDIYYVNFKGLKYQVYTADNKACIYLSDKRTGNVL